MKWTRQVFALALMGVMLAGCGKGGDASAAEGKSVNAKNENTTTTSAKKRYEVKSGRIEAEFGPKGMTMKRVLWFDDYGVKERTDLFYNNELTEINLVDGTHKYSIRLADEAKKAWKTKWAYGLQKEVNIKSVKGGKGITILPKRTILGFECDTYQAEHKGTVVTMAGYKGVQLLMESTGKMAVTDKATKAEFDIVIPDDKFSVPEGYTVTEQG